MSSAWGWAAGAAGDAWDAAKDVVGSGAEALAGQNSARINPSDPNSFEWGGQKGGAQADIDRYRQQAASVDSRGVPNVYGQGYMDDRAIEGGARGQQQDALGLAQQAALGNAPSVAALQMQQGLNQGLQQQASMAASARGGGANLAAAQRAAAMGGAQMTGNTINNAAQLRAGEMAQARGQYLGGAGQIRSADQARTAQSGQMGVAQANTAIANQGLNDARAMGLEQLGFQTGKAQLEAQGAKATSEQGTQEANAGIKGQNSANLQKTISGGIGAAASAAGGKSDARVKTAISDASTDAEILAHPGEGGFGRVAQGDEANAKIHAIKMAYGSGNQRAMDIGFGDNAVYKNNAGGFSSLEGGDVGSEANSFVPIPVHQLRNSMALPSDKHSKEKIQALEAENAALKPVSQLAHASNPQELHAAQASWGQDPRKWTPEQKQAHMDRVGEMRAQAMNAEQTAPVATAAPLPAEPGIAERALGHAKGFGRYMADGGPGGVLARGIVSGAPVAAQAVGGAMQGAGQYVASLGSGSQPAAAAMSDERTKSSASALGNAPPAKMMDQLHPYAFNYKPGTPGEDPSHRYYGVMAQDVEKSPMGASIVKDTPEGKQLDVQHGFGAALAAMGNLNDRMRALEGKRGK